MMEDIHIPGGIAVKLLLAGLVLASGAVGALGLAHGTSQAAAAGLGDGHSAQAAFPIDNFSMGAGTQLRSMDGTGNDRLPAAAFPIDNVTTAFPIDNVTATFPIDNVSVSGGSWDVMDTSGIGGIEAGSGVNTFSLARVEAPDELPQDMDPY